MLLYDHADSWDPTRHLNLSRTPRGSATSLLHADADRSVQSTKARSGTPKQPDKQRVLAL